MKMSRLKEGDPLPFDFPEEWENKLRREEGLSYHPKLARPTINDIGESLITEFFMRRRGIIVAPMTIDELRMRYERDMSELGKQRKGKGHKKVQGMDVSECYVSQAVELRWWGYVDAARHFGVLIED